MNRKILTMSVVALGLSLGACNRTESPAEERREARKEMGEALEEHKEEVHEARKDEEDAAARAKEITEANRELAQEHKEAYEDVEEAQKEQRDDMDRGQPGSKQAVLDERFEAYKDETKQQFQMRAQARIEALEQELRSMAGRAKGEEASEEIADAKESLAEARKDLDEVVGGTEEVFDDGKAGVAVAINRARRAVADVQKDVSEE